MNFKKSPYYNIEFLGKEIYEQINDKDEILTIQEFFRIKNRKKEYWREGLSISSLPYNYILTIQDEYYELNCQNYDIYLYLVFDKPVHIIGRYCSKIIAPEIVIKNCKNGSMFECVVNKAIVNNDFNDFYYISNSKVNNICFYGSKVRFWDAEINNFFIFDKSLRFREDSRFLERNKIKFFGSCEDLKKKILNYKDFKQGIIHIE